MSALRAVLVTATDVVPERVLFARIEAAAALPWAVRAGIAVQLRDPQLSGRALFALGARLRASTRTLGMRLVVNGRIDLAIALDADGVHLGGRSPSVADARALLGAGAWISVSAHSPEDVGRAYDAGVDAALLSPIFATPGKGRPLGLEGLRAALALVASRPARQAPGLDPGRPLALIALGGIDAHGMRACRDAGADGVAAIRSDLVAALAAG